MRRPEGPLLQKQFSCAGGVGETFWAQRKHGKW